MSSTPLNECDDAKELLALLQSAAAQVQLVATMISRLEVEDTEKSAPTEAVESTTETELREHAAFFAGREDKESAAVEIPAEDQGWTFSLEPEEVERAEAIAKALDFPEGNTTITEIVVRGLLSLEAEISRSREVLDSGNPSPVPGAAEAEAFGADALAATRAGAGWCVDPDQLAMFGRPCPEEGWRAATLEDAEAESI